MATPQLTTALDDLTQRAVNETDPFGQRCIIHMMGVAEKRPCVIETLPSGLSVEALPLSLQAGAPVTFELGNYRTGAVLTIRSYGQRVQLTRDGPKKAKRYVLGCPSQDYDNFEVCVKAAEQAIYC